VYARGAQAGGFEAFAVGFVELEAVAHR